MKAALVFLLFVCPVFAQTNPIPVPVSSCGSINIQFDVKQNQNKQDLVHAPEPGKALVYFIEQYPSPADNFIIPTVRIGLDGSWVGATRGASYFFFSVDPGEHHLCVSWQTVYKSVSSQFSLTSFTAEGGKSYFFRVEPREEALKYGDAWNKGLAAINSDEAMYLMANSPLSVPHPKK
jgi:hypothetical protein